MPSPIEQRGYARPEVLVSTDWVAEHLDDPNVRFIESNEDPLVYAGGHIPGAVEVDWIRHLNDPVRRDYLDQDGFQTLMRHIGATKDTTLVLYGDRSNWWACYAFWVFQLFGHSNARVIDGGRIKWEKEGRELTRKHPTFAPSGYAAPLRDDTTIRAFRDDVLAHCERRGKLIDVRSPEEYRGDLLHMPDHPNEGALRGGHIPGAFSVPWANAIDPETGVFLPADALRRIYEGEAGLANGDDVVVYCRIGERSSHTWFVLSYLLGYEHVRNYDGSWTEWGNLVNVPIARP